MIDDEFGQHVYPGDRVEVSPGLDVWMMGDRYGTVIKVTNRRVTCIMHRSGKVRRFAPGDIYRVVATA